VRAHALAYKVIAFLSNIQVVVHLGIVVVVVVAAACNSACIYMSLSGFEPSCSCYSRVATVQQLHDVCNTYGAAADVDG